MGFVDGDGFQIWSPVREKAVPTSLPREFDLLEALAQESELPTKQCSDLGISCRKEYLPLTRQRDVSQMVKQRQGIDIVDVCHWIVKQKNLRACSQTLVHRQEQRECIGGTLSRTHFVKFDVTATTPNDCQAAVNLEVELVWRMDLRERGCDLGGVFAQDSLHEGTLRLLAKQVLKHRVSAVNPSQLHA